jgi:hypothetical protein
MRRVVADIVLMVVALFAIAATLWMLTAIVF